MKIAKITEGGYKAQELQFGVAYRCGTPSASSPSATVATNRYSLARIPLAEAAQIMPATSVGSYPPANRRMRSFTPGATDTSLRIKGYLLELELLGNGENPRCYLLFSISNEALQKD